MDSNNNADVMSVISHQSCASETYHEVKDLLKGIFKAPAASTAAPINEDIQASSIQHLTPGGKGGDKISNLGSIMNEISRVELSASPAQRS